MLRRDRLRLNKEVIMTITGTSFTRTYKKGPVTLKDARITPLSAFPTKSAAFKIDAMEYSQVPGGLDLPPSVVFKIYRPGVERTSETVQTSCRDEYNIEKAVLGECRDLKCDVDGRNVRLYPRCYSLEVPEADSQMCIVREYVKSKSLDKIAEEEGDNLIWMDVRDGIQPIALLHVNTPWLVGEISGLESMSSESMGKGFANYVEKIASASGRTLDSAVKQRIASLFSSIAKQYLDREEFLGVINGDLDIYLHHLTPNMMLDAGSTRIGPFVCDLAAYADPSLTRLGNLQERGRQAIQFYKQDRKTISENLQWSDGILDKFSEDFLVTAFLVAALKGSVRRAASIINYKSEYLPEWGKRVPGWFPRYLKRISSKDQLPREQFDREVNSFIQNSYDSLAFLRQVGDSDKRIFSELEGALRQAIPEHFEINPVWYKNPALDVSVNLGLAKT